MAHKFVVRAGVWWGGLGLVSLAQVFFGQVAVSAQTAQVTASLGNFDVVTYTGKLAYGYEVETKTVNAQSVYATLCPGGAVILRNGGRVMLEAHFSGLLDVRTVMKK